MLFLPITSGAIVRNPMLVGVYVDDLSIASARTSTLKNFKNEMSNRYGHDRHGWTPLHPGASGQVRRARRSHNLCQTPYIHWILDGFKMEDWKPAKYPLGASRAFDLEHHMRGRLIEPYLSIICSLMYAMLGALPDIAYIIGWLPQFDSDSSLEQGRRGW
jgi:hypothetical protein